MCNVQYNKTLSDSILCFKKPSADAVQPDEMSNTKSCICATAVFLNHYLKMYYRSLIDMRSYKIRQSIVSRDKIRASPNL
jgi:hypothetical protein